VPKIKSSNFRSEMVDLMKKPMGVFGGSPEFLRHSIGTRRLGLAARATSAALAVGFFVSPANCLPNCTINLLVLQTGRVKNDPHFFKSNDLLFEFLSR